MQNFITFDFIKDSKKLENAPVCGMTVRAAGSMRFRWNETNLHRDEQLKEIAGYISPLKNIKPVAVELIHSKNVYCISEAHELDQIQADGIITKNKELMPVVTVADCMPLYLYDPVHQVFGIVHSGWKGTGIIAEAVNLAGERFGTEPADCSVVLGPHIRNCCYIVNEERARYFSDNFTPDCVVPLEDGGTCYAGGRGLTVDWNYGGGRLYRLSLEKANLSVLEKCGIKKENINIIKECTCCNELFGSNRRETASGKIFTVQAAFIGMK